MTRSLGATLPLLGALLVAPVPGAAQEGPEFDEDVLEITADVLERFVVGAEAEAGERARGFASDPRLAEATRRAACLEGHRSALDAAWELPSGRAEAEYRRIVDRMWEECAPGERPGDGEVRDVEAWVVCAAGFEAKAQAHVDDYVAAQERGDMAAVRRSLAAIDRVREEMEESCGPEPDEDDDWGDWGAMQEPPDPFLDDPEVQEAVWVLESVAEETAARTGGFTARQYGVVRERVQAFLVRSLEDNRLQRYLFAPAEARLLERNRARLEAALRPLDLLEPTD